MSPLFWVVLFVFAIAALLTVALIWVLDEPRGITPTWKQRRQWKRERADITRAARR